MSIPPPPPRPMWPNTMPAAVSAAARLGPSRVPALPYRMRDRRGGLTVAGSATRAWRVTSGYCYDRRSGPNFGSKHE